MDAQNQRSPFSDLSEEERRILRESWAAPTPQAQSPASTFPTLNEEEKKQLSQGWGTLSSPPAGAGASQPIRPTWQDTGLSLGSGVLSGTPKVAGLPGALASGYVGMMRSASTPVEQPADGGQKYYVPMMAPGAAGQLREISPEQAQSMRWGDPNIVERALTYTTPEALRGYMEYLPYYKAAAEYPPQTVPGKFAKAVGEELPMAVIPGGTMAQRVMGAVGSGAGAEAVRSAAGDKPPPPWLEAAGALAGSFTGAFGYPALKGAIAPFVRSGESLAESATVKALKQELATASPERAQAIRGILKEAADTGVSPENVMPISLLGKDSIKKLAPNLPTNPTKVDEINQTIGALYQNAPQNAARDIAALVGRPSPIVFTQEQAFLSDLKNAINNPNYARVMASPDAASIPNELYADVIRYSLFKDHLPGIMASVEPLKYRHGIVAPDFERNIPGNLAFWDSAKKYFDRLGDVEKTQNEAFRAIAQQIRQSSDIAVPAYASTRDVASELLGYENAMKLGYDLIDTTNKKLAAQGPQLYRALGTMSPEEKSNLAIGMVGRLTDMMIPANKAADVSKLLESLKSQEAVRRLSYAFSRDEIAGMYGTAARNALIAKTPLIPVGQESRVSLPLLGGAAAGIGSMAANFFVQQAVVDPTVMHVTAAALGAALGQAKSAAQRRAADQLVQYLGDPSKTVQLGRLLANSSEARGMYARLNQAMSEDAAVYVAAKSQSAVNRPEEPSSGAPPLTIPGNRPQRATGGRISPEAMADRIMGQIDKARKELQAQTGTLLNHDDETIVKALKVANERI